MVQVILSSPKHYLHSQLSGKPKVLYLPYIQHIAEPIQRVCRQLGVKIVFRTAQTLRQQLVKVKKKKQTRALNEECHL